MTVEAPESAVPDLLRHGRLVVLTGAGLSTDSGIPDYRGPGSPARQPMTYQEFVSGPEARQRYWARSHLGWSRMRPPQPNAGHRALAALDPELADHPERRRPARGGRARAAGRAARPDRRGRLPRLPAYVSRARAAAAAWRAANPGVRRRATPSVETRPDGDVELDDTAGFVVPDCDACGGVLKPDVVFFGENVPPARVQRATTRSTRSRADDALLVVGSSLTVMSGLPVRTPRREGRHTRRDRQPRRHPRRRPGGGEGRGGVHGVPDGLVSAR